MRILSVLLAFNVKSPCVKFLLARSFNVVVRREFHHVVKVGKQVL